MIVCLAATQTAPLAPAAPVSSDPFSLLSAEPVFYAMAVIVVVGAYLSMVWRSEGSAIVSLVACLLGMAGLFVFLNAFVLAAVQAAIALAIGVALRAGNRHLRSARPTGPVTASSFLVRTVMGMMYAVGLFGFGMSVFVFNNASAWETAPASPDAPGIVAIDDPAPYVASDAAQIGAGLLTNHLATLAIVGGFLIVALIGTVTLVRQKEESAQ